MLVVDASVIAPAVADGGPDGEACRARIKGQSLAAPDLLRVEAVSVIRRQLLNGALTATQATNAIDDLLDLPIIVYPTAALLRRAWGCVTTPPRTTLATSRSPKPWAARSSQQTNDSQTHQGPAVSSTSCRAAGHRTSTCYRAVRSHVSPEVMRASERSCE